MFRGYGVFDISFGISTETGQVIQHLLQNVNCRRNFKRFIQKHPGIRLADKAVVAADTGRYDRHSGSKCFNKYASCCFRPGRVEHQIGTAEQTADILPRSGENDLLFR